MIVQTLIATSNVGEQEGFDRVARMLSRKQLVQFIRTTDEQLQSMKRPITPAFLGAVLPFRPGKTRGS